MRQLSTTPVHRLAGVFLKMSPQKKLPSADSMHNSARTAVYPQYYYYSYYIDKKSFCKKQMKKHLAIEANKLED